MPQLARIARIRGAFLNLRWPYQALGMNTFEHTSSRAALRRSSMVLLVYNNGAAFVSRGAKPVEDPVAAIERGELAPIYCLYGAERYQVDRCLVALREAVVGGKAAAFAAFNHDVFDLKETSLAAVVDTARTLPKMAPRRLVVGKGIDGVKSDELAPLTAYAGDPNPSTCLVLVGEQIDTRFKAYQVLRKAGYLHEFAALRDREVAGWVAREARARKLRITPDAVAALAESAGPEMARLAGALEQLALYVGERASITIADVEALIPETRQRSVIELTKAIGEGDAGRALRILTNMFRNREPAQRVQFMQARPAS